MTWGNLLEHWHGQVGRITEIFPHADPCALVRFRGNRDLLAQYIADTHDLTVAEGHEAIDLRLLPAARHKIFVPPLVAAE